MASRSSVRSRMPGLLQRVAKLESATGVSLRVDDLGRDFEGINMHGGVEARPEITNIVYTNVALYNETHYLPIDEHTHYQNDGSVWTESHLQEGPVNVEPDHAIPAVTQKQLHALRPERVYSIKLASAHTLWNALTQSPSASYTRISNLFSWAHELQHVVNSGAYGVLSLEFDARADLRSLRLSAGASHVYQRPIAPDRHPRPRDRRVPAEHYGPVRLTSCVFNRRPATRGTTTRCWRRWRFVYPLTALRG